ncbi:MAG TPA: hypothetical protein VM029_17030, partial [Opitutaceae bacterium]|nr:hypothetical protein [Opitutaceae bacterium]
QRPEIDALLARFAQWTLTDVWTPSGAISNKGGSPNRGGSPQHIGTHSRMMAHVYEQTRDPMYLVVPWKLATAGFGGPNSKPIPGTRSVGMVYNYLPWLISSFHKHGDPTPEPQFELTTKADSLALAPGAKGRVAFTVKNTGRQPLDDLRVSFHSRRDFTITSRAALPARLLPGESAECSYDVQAPAQINLTCDYNAVAFGHWSALYRRDERAHLAHKVFKIVLTAPAGAEPDKTQ